MEEYFKSLAQRAGQLAGIPWQWIYSQWQFETANFTSLQTFNLHNLGGVTGTNGDFMNFNTWEDFADYFGGDYLPRYASDGLYNSKTLDDYLNALYHGGYFTTADNENNKYFNGVNQYFNQLSGNDAQVGSVNSPGVDIGGVTVGGMILPSSSSNQNSSIAKGIGSVTKAVTDTFGKWSDFGTKVIKIIVGLVLLVLGLVLLTKTDTLTLVKEDEN